MARPDGSPAPEAQRNFTNTDGKIMKNGQGAFEQAFNGQVVVDESHVIVAHGLTNLGADAPHVPVMLARAAESLGRAPGELHRGQRLLLGGQHPGGNRGRGRPSQSAERRTWPPSPNATGAPPGSGRPGMDGVAD